MFNSIRHKLAAACAVTASALALTFAPLPAAVAHGHGHEHATAKVGEAAPDFTLTDLRNNEHTLSDFTNEGKVVVLEWFSPSCPFVVKHYADEERQTINSIAADYADQNVVVLAINSAHPGHPYADPAKNLKAIESWGMSHSILMDPTGEVGKTYGAQKTPEMYIVDTEGVLRYAGALDNNSKPGRGQIGDVNYVRQALDEILAGSAVSTPTTKAYGCSVKYAK
ncbi:MAG: thioredoxin family protein [Planctomycetota bacterium]